MNQAVCQRKEHRTALRMIIATVGGGVLLALLPSASAGADAARSVADEIRIEATRPNFSPEGRPLPLLSHWTSGGHRFSEGWEPRHQMDWIAEGHYLLPWFRQPGLDEPVGGDTNNYFFVYYEAPIKRARDLKLPIVFVSSQWERLLSEEPYVSLPPEKNPNVVTTNGEVLRIVCPFGPLDPWREVGRKYTDNPPMRQLQQWYPDPPLVIFLSNNEHSKLTWENTVTERCFLRKYGTGRDGEFQRKMAADGWRDGDFRRKVVADGWIERYRALQDAMRDGLGNATWRKNARFVGYDAFGPSHVGRWGGWLTYSLYSPGRIDPSPLMWDGGSPSYYTHNWNPSTDFTVWSPQLEFMNLVFMQTEAYRLNANFWLELSIWDGYTGGTTEAPLANDKRKYYAGLGQTYTPKRYAAMAQFGMWLLRPRALREFRSWIHPWEDGKPYFMALVAAVDRVHTNPILREWWRKGELVPNRARQHHYQADIPAEYKNADRWFLLDADCNPQKRPWELSWTVNVFSLALTRGKMPDREWLVYAHAPLGERKNVKLTIPDYGQINVDVPVAGAFFQVAEKRKSIELVADAAQQRETPP